VKTYSRDLGKAPPLGGIGDPLGPQGKSPARFLGGTLGPRDPGLCPIVEKPPGKFLPQRDELFKKFAEEKRGKIWELRISH